MPHLKSSLCTLLAAAALAAGASSGAQAALTDKEKSIVPIAALTARGDEARLRGALEESLQKGLTVTEIRSVLEQMYAYTGFPRSLTALGVFVKVLDARKAQGINDPHGREPTPLPEGASIRELGTKTQTALVGRPVAGPVYDLSPAIDTYLKEHLFGDIFANDLLTWREREIATVAALAALPAPAQLRSHLNVCLNVGITPDELRQFASIIRERLGKDAGELVDETLKTVLKSRN